MSDDVRLHVLTAGSNTIWIEFHTEQLAYAQSIGGNHYRLGYLHLVVNMEEWNDQPGNRVVDANGDEVLAPIPVARVQPPPLPLNATANMWSRYNIQHKEYTDEIAFTEKIRKFGFKGIGPDNINIISEPRVGTRNITSTQLMELMRELMRELYGAPDATTISAWTEELNRPHASDNTVVKTMSRQRHLHTKLADAGQPMSEFEKIKLFEKSVENYAGALKLVRMYKEREPLVRDQLFLDLMTLVILHEPSLTTGAMGFSASAAISRSEVEALIARSVEDAYARGLAAGARGSGPGRSGGRGGRGGRGPPLGGRGRGLVRNYCHLHGYDGHTSSRCYTMAADTATYSSAMRAATSHTLPAGGSTLHM